jgi:hypothetical protein
MDRFKAGVAAGEGQAPAWVLLVGDPRGGFAVIGPFGSQGAAESRASRWEGIDCGRSSFSSNATGEDEASSTHSRDVPSV